MNGAILVFIDNKEFLNINPNEFTDEPIQDIKYYLILNEISEFYYEKKIKNKFPHASDEKSSIVNYLINNRYIKIEAFICLKISSFESFRQCRVESICPFPFTFLKKKNIFIFECRMNFIKGLMFNLSTIFRLNIKGLIDNIKSIHSKRVKSKKYRYVLKSWVGVANEIYQEFILKHNNNVIVWIQPFHIDEKRKKKFYKDIKNSSVDYLFLKFKIEFLPLLKTLIKFIECNPFIVESLLRYKWDFLNYNRMIRIINKFNPDAILTKEEFWPLSNYQTCLFNKYNVKVFNSTHGTGLYKGLHNYDGFIVYGDFFKDFLNKSSMLNKNRFLLKGKDLPVTTRKLAKVQTVGIALQYIVPGVISKKSRMMLIELASELTNYKNVHISFREHPNHPNDDITPNFNLKEPHEINTDRVGEWLEKCDLIVTSHSAIALEFMALGGIVHYLHELDISFTPIAIKHKQSLSRSVSEAIEEVEKLISDDAYVLDYFNKQHKALEYVNYNEEKSIYELIKEKL